MITRDYTGLWVSPDHGVRKMLLPNGRFIVLVGNGEKRAQGDYRIVGSRVIYHKDSGTTGEGEIIDGVLYGGGFALYQDGVAEAAA